MTFFNQDLTFRISFEGSTGADREIQTIVYFFIASQSGKQLCIDIVSAVKGIPLVPKQQLWWSQMINSQRMQLFIYSIILPKQQVKSIIQSNHVVDSFCLAPSHTV